MQRTARIVGRRDYLTLTTAANRLVSANVKSHHVVRSCFPSSAPRAVG